MKKMNKLFIYVFAILVCAGFVSCDDTDKGGAKGEFVFSEIKDLDLSLLDNQEMAIGYFTLSASERCTVSSDRLWVTFSTTADGEFYYDIQCDKTVSKVYVKVSNEARGFSDAIAKITLVANGNEQPVATITRQAKTTELVMKDAEDAVMNELRIDENATVWVRFDANYECGILDYPAWLMEPVYESEGYRLNVIEDSVPMEQKGMLVVGNSSKTIEKQIAIKYDGMNPEAMTVGGDDPWAWIVSLDGKEFKKDESSLSDATENPIIEGGLNMTVMCRDYLYRLVCAEDTDSLLSFLDAADAWINAECVESNDPKSLYVTVDELESGSHRSGFLFAVPTAAYDSFIASLDDNDSTSVFVDKYESYVLAQVTQKDAGFNVFLVEDGVEVEIPCVSGESYDYYDFLNSEYSTSDIMACNVELGKNYKINTKLTADEWYSMDYYQVLDIAKTEIDEIMVFDFWVEEDEDGFYVINITVPEEWNEKYKKDVVLRLFNPGPVNIKLLVLKIQ